MKITAQELLQIPNYPARWSRVAEDEPPMLPGARIPDEPPMLPGARVLYVPFMFTGYLQDQDARLEDINTSSNCINPAPRTEGMPRGAAPPTTSHTRLPRFTAARDRLAFSRHGRAGRGCYDNRLEATVIGHIKPDVALRRRLPATMRHLKRLSGFKNYSVHDCKSPQAIT